MELTIERWDLLEAGRVVPLLRLVRDGVPLTEAGTTDCFLGPVEVAEAAYHLDPDTVLPGHYLRDAEAALAGAPSGRLPLPGAPPIRVVTIEMMETRRVGWLPPDPEDPLSGESTSNWALAQEAGVVAGGKHEVPEANPADLGRPYPFAADDVEPTGE